MFREMDADGDNLVSFKEFKDYFIRTQGLAMGIQRVKKLFLKILKKERGNVSMEKLTNQQISSFLKEEESPNPIDEETLQTIKTIEEYIAVANIAGVNVCNMTLDIIAEGLTTKQWKKTLKKLTEKGSALQVSLTEQGNRRWQQFAGYKRIVEGQTLLSASERIVRDLLPGIENYSRISHFISICRAVPSQLSGTA